MAQIATITVETAGGSVDLPVYEPGDSGSNRLEAFRVQTASGPGFVPLAAVDEADRPYLRVQTSSGVRAVDTSASGIPDSAVLRWSLSDGTGTTAGDSIGSNDLSISGASWISGTYQDDYALEFAIDDSAIAASKVTTISETNSFSIGITVDSVYSGSSVIAEQLDGDSTGFTIGGADGNLAVRDWNNNSVSDNTPPTGKTRVLVTWDTANLSLYVNTTQKTDGDICSNGSAAGNLRLGEGNGDPGFHYDGIIDDVIVYDSVLTSSEIQKDYDIQPWS